MENVRDFGAHGNGVDDDTDAFRDVLNACAPGETCFVPVGIYMIRPSGAVGVRLPSYLELSSTVNPGTIQLSS
jgi:polygalacturonase